MLTEIGPDEQLGHPVDLAFDNKGNLYVCDAQLHRVQMFTLIDNRPCSPTSTGSSWILSFQ
jgi:hypothetical protein